LTRKNPGMQPATNEYVKRWAKKMVVLHWLGGKCSKCGETNLMVIEFHHTRDKTRSLQVGGSIDSQSFRDELVKCVALCRRCHQEEKFKTPTVRSKLKDRLMELAGGSSCSICGYKGKNAASLEFHHRDMVAKEFTIGTVCRGNGLLLPVDIVAEEVGKCDVLCSNCHALRHYDEAKFNANLDAIKRVASKYESWRRNKRVDDAMLVRLSKEGKTVKEICEATGASVYTISTALTRLGIPSRKRLLKKHILSCMVCGGDFEVFGETDRKNRRCCSSACASRTAGCGKRPTMEELKEALGVKTIAEVARQYGVDATTVYRWKKGDRWFKAA